MYKTNKFCKMIIVKMSITKDLDSSAHALAIIKVLAICLQCGVHQLRTFSFCKFIWKNQTFDKNVIIQNLLINKVSI